MNCCLQYPLGQNDQVVFFYAPKLFPGSISTKERLGQLKVANIVGVSALWIIANSCEVFEREFEEYVSSDHYTYK